MREKELPANLAAPLNMPVGTSRMPAGIRIFLYAFSLSRSGKKSMKKM